MIRPIAITVLFLSFAFSAPAEEIRGAWTAEISEKNPDRIHLQMNRRNNNFGQTMDMSSYTGLRETEVASATRVPVNFSLRREAGVVHYEGTFEDGFGGGQFTFVSNPEFFESVRALGVDVARARTKHLGLMQFAILDVSTAYIRSMQAEGYRGSLDQYLEFRIFNVTPDLVRNLRNLGYRDVSASQLVASLADSAVVAQAAPAAATSPQRPISHASANTSSRNAPTRSPVAPEPGCLASSSPRWAIACGSSAASTAPPPDGPGAAGGSTPSSCATPRA